MACRPVPPGPFSHSEDLVLLGEEGLRLSYGRVVLMHLLAQCADLPLDDRVSHLLVGQHLLHEVKFPLKEASSAQVRVDLNGIALVAHCSQSFVQVIELFRLLVR